MKLPACVGLVIFAGSFSVISILFPTSAGADVQPVQGKILLSRLKESAIKIYETSEEGTEKNVVKLKELLAQKKSRENHDIVIAGYSSQPDFCDLIPIIKAYIEALCFLLPPYTWVPVPGLPLAIANLKSILNLLLLATLDPDGNCRCSCSLPNVVVSP